MASLVVVIQQRPMADEIERGSVWGRSQRSGGLQVADRFEVRRVRKEIDQG